MRPDGRKIPAKIENPIDNVFISLAICLNKNILSRSIVHPNAVTAASLAVGLASSYFLFRSWYVMAGVLYALAYFLDCVDGNLARMTDSETVFGDWFDHISDIIKTITLTIVYVYNIRILPVLKYVFVIGSIMLGIMALLHLACQEKHSNADIISPFFTMARCIMPISVSKYFGLGTFVIFQTFMIIFPALYS